MNSSSSSTITIRFSRVFVLVHPRAMPVLFRIKTRLESGDPKDEIKR